MPYCSAAVDGAGGELVDSADSRCPGRSGTGHAAARFFLFTSHHRFCLSDGPQWRVGDGQVAPAFIALDPEAGYVVWKGCPYDAGATIAVSTADPGVPAAELEQLLVSWPMSGA